ncbi:Heat shock protein DnaJ domain protein (modular protein) [Planktothrix serta PCC 8927]|uniref:Heat shock protein DnaJ domain protein (Modular protein) n=1 Tax=Planktothrix serta PCC 8927 TaxID=671068 RepID=A0A7Z9BGA3_9CYAN|nr:J domain-containing protein [Planktothrix serta]VXD12333.1 Heat shock protein DnaJ domain protein (modular protein) [Planktothrix serta PCC 8927]
MTSPETSSQQQPQPENHPALSSSYYTLLGLHPSATPIEIRRAYRELSKLYHPDTTTLSKAIATAKFQKLNEAYATLSNPERRQSYDLKIGYSRYHVIQVPTNFNQPYSKTNRSPNSSAYLDPTDRPLSAGEIFALFLMGVSLIGCLLLAIFIGLTRSGGVGESIQPLGFLIFSNIDFLGLVKTAIINI